MELREMTRADLPELARLNCAIFKDSAEEHVLSVMEHSFRNRITGSCLVAVEGGAIIGAVFAERSVSFASAGSAYMRSVFVDDARRGRGMGQALVSSSLDALRKSGIGHVSLAVHPGNKAAIALYEKLGFSLSRLQYSRRL